MLNLEFGSYSNTDTGSAGVNLPPLATEAITDNAESQVETIDTPEESGRLSITIFVGLVVLLVLFLGGGYVLIGRTQKSASKK